ncbi:MAG TPA: DUF262 domain-containing HNH endonuclease family protein [Candidatus Acidoferrales bacterium]|nr:DUF262 domain-containing HNH endonuclease family protein [Candidatus Acidoferrales bacterium]
MIQPRPTTIGEILTLSKHFIVPKYQRGYEWGKGEAEEFLNDLETESQFSRGLFLGTLIFNISDDANNKITIVDGQQRLTSIFLLLVACRVLANRIKANGIAQETQKRITVTDPATARSAGPLLGASESISDVFEVMAASSWDGDLPAKIGSKSVRLQTRRIRPVYESFKQWTKDYDQEKLSKLLDSIYKTRAIRIDIDGDEEAFNIFERMNARGMDLEVFDLLKNYLYQQQVPDLDKEWKEILGNSDGTILKMLKYFYVSRNGPVSKSDLYPGLKSYCKKLGGAANLVEALKQFSSFYNLVRTEEPPAAIKKYFELKECKAISSDADKYHRVHLALQALRLFKVSQTYPVIYAALSSLIESGEGGAQGPSKLFLKLLDAMEKYHFINNAVCDRVGNEVEKLYAGFCKKFSETKDFEKTLNELISSLRGQLASEDEFTTRFAEISYGRDTIALIAYIFDRFSNHSLRPGERVSIYDPQPGVDRKNHNIEHWLAQKQDEDTPIDSSTRMALDNIGNLLVISFSANSSLGNLPPAKKVQKLRGDLSKKIQNLPYVRDFLDKYADKAEAWNDDAINQRAKDMAREAYRHVWRIA